MKEQSDLDEYAPWLVLIVMLIGGALRVLLLEKNGMWLDETFSVWVANHSVGEMLPWIVKVDQHPPLYYLLLHYWIALNGDTPYYARLFSALIGAGTIPVIYLIGKRLAGAVVGLIAAVLLAVSPFNIYFAQETRMYTLLAFNAAVAIYALARLLTDARAARPIGSQFREWVRVWRVPRPIEPGAQAEFTYSDQRRDRTGWRTWLSRHRRLPLEAVETDLAWVAFIVFSAATLLTHNTAALFLVAVNVFVLGLMLYQKLRRSDSPPALQAPSFGNWIKALVGIFILWSPWIFAFSQQVGRVFQGFWIPAPNGDAIARTLRYLMNDLVPSQTSQVMMWALVGLLVMGLVYCRKRLSVFLFLACLFVIPFAGELIVSLRQPIFLDRTLIWITIPLFVALAAGIALLRYRLLMILVLGILVANYLFAASDYFRFVSKEDWDTAAGYVANFAHKDDLVLFNSNFVEIPFDYYFQMYEHRYSIEVEKRGVPQDLFESGILEPRMTQADVPGLLAALRGHDRVWLVSSHSDYTDPAGLIAQTLAAHMKLTRTRDFYGGQVQLYETP